jgi:hypothetical protein
VADALAGHAAPRDPVQLMVDERNQSLESDLVALAPFEQQPGDIRIVFGDAAILCVRVGFGVSCAVSPEWAAGAAVVTPFNR